MATTADNKLFTQKVIPSVQRDVLKYTVETPKENSRKYPNNPQESKKERAGIKYRE